MIARQTDYQDTNIIKETMSAKATLQRNDGIKPVFKSKVPEGIDTSALAFLQKGDVTRVANELKEDPNYVSRIKLGKSYNVKILSALIKKGLENKKSLNPQQ